MKLVYNGEEISTGGGGGTSFPSGGIIIWSGSSDNIPDGWALCDGDNGTPDLRGRFVLGESETYSIGSTGGSEEVTLTVEQMPEHSHSYTYHNQNGQSASGSGQRFMYSNTDQFSTTSAGDSEPHPNMPPYYVLAYIMKL